MLSVLVKTSSLPSLRSTSHGTFEHVGGASIRRRRSSRRVSTFCRRASWTGLGAQYASSVVAASGRYALARASSETHVALCIRLSIPSTTRQRDDKNRIIEFSMNPSPVVGATLGREDYCKRNKISVILSLFLYRIVDEPHSPAASHVYLVK